MAEHDHADERAALGSVLRSAREARGLEVADVARAINLRATVVRAMERDDFSLCGGHVYARGHLRAFAKQVGLDPAPLLATYAEEHAGPVTGPGAGSGTASGSGSGISGSGSSGPATGPIIRPRVAAADLDADPPTQPVRRVVPATPARPAATSAGPVAPLSRRSRAGRDVPLERSGPNWTVVVGAVLAVLVVLLVVQLVGDLRGPGRGTNEVASPVTASPTSGSGGATGPGSTTAPSPSSSGSTGTGSSGSPTSGATATDVADGVRLALKATGESWVSVRDASGRTVFSGLLSKGDARRFRDGKGLRLTLGNAGAVQLTVNGKSMGSAGGDGQVVRLHFGPGDPA